MALESGHLTTRWRYHTLGQGIL